jgi:hypothetical protein
MSDFRECKPCKKLLEFGGMTDSSKASLVNLTRDFIALLVSHQGDEVDLIDAGNQLAAARRRLYDGTTVGAGIG